MKIFVSLNANLLKTREIEEMNIYYKKKKRRKKKFFRSFDHYNQWKLVY